MKIIPKNLLEYWEQHRPAKYETTPVDKLRYTTIQQSQENAWNFIDEEHPRSGKSEANNLYAVAHTLSLIPNYKFGLITHMQALGNKFLAGVVNELEKDGFEFEYVRANEFKLKGSTGIDPSFWVSGIEGGHTGKGCHRIILDDLLRSGSDAMSAKIRERIIRDVVSTALNRLEPFNGKPGAATVCQARLHKADPVGWLLDESGLQYVRLHLPAVNDDGLHAYLENTYEEGAQIPVPRYDALTPRFPRAELEKIKRYSNEYFWAAQWLMEPSIGNMTYFDLTRCPREDHPHVDHWWMGCDFAQTATDTGSRTAFVALGFDTRAGRLSLMGCEYGRWRQDEMQSRLLQFTEAMMRLTGRRPLKVIVEAAAGGYGVLDLMKGQIPELEPITPRGSKEMRAGDVCPLVNRGQLTLPNDAPWLSEFEKEVGGFPLEANSDIPDALVHALKFACSPREFKEPEEQLGIMTYDSQDWDSGLSAGLSSDLGNSAEFHRMMNASMSEEIEPPRESSLGEMLQQDYINHMGGKQ